jgi:acetylornithine/succinyldiaminopimelate/putrescine aminotransferase
MEEQQQSFHFQMTKMHKILVLYRRLYQNSYDDTDALEAALKSSPNIAFLVEPIQGEAGVYVPTEGYFMKAKALQLTMLLLQMKYKQECLTYWKIISYLW